MRSKACELARNQGPVHSESGKTCSYLYLLAILAAWVCFSCVSLEDDTDDAAIVDKPSFVPVRHAPHFVFNEHAVTFVPGHDAHVITDGMHSFCGCTHTASFSGLSCTSSSPTTLQRGAKITLNLFDATAPGSHQHHLAGGQKIADMIKDGACEKLLSQTHGLQVMRGDAGLPSLGDKGYRFASANICTLRPKQIAAAKVSQGILYTQRVSYLDNAFFEAGFGVIGAQESRLQGNQRIRSDKYVITSSGADESGCYGAQIWTRCDLAANISCELPVSPRVCFLMNVIENVPIIFGSGHGPVELSPLGVLQDVIDKDAFWNSLQKGLDTMKRVNSEAEVVLFVDNNGTVGSINCAAVGKINKANETVNGSRLRAFATLNKLVLINTFISSDDGSTFVGARGGRRRIDYVLLSRSLAFSALNTCSAVGVDLATWIKDDHFPLAADLDFNKVNAFVTWKQEVVPQELDTHSKLDPHKMMGPACVHLSAANSIAAR